MRDRVVAPLVYLPYGMVPNAAAWLTGTLLASRLSLMPVAWALWLASSALLLLLWWRDPALRRIHFCLVVFLLAALRYTTALPIFDDHSLATLNNRGAVLLAGQVTDPPEAHDQLRLVRLAVARARINGEWRDVSGLALVQIPRESDVQYGDVLELYGEPTTPPESENFSYKDYLARQGVYSLVRAYGGARVLARDQGNPFFTALYAFRDRARSTVLALFPEPAAALLIGILLGDDSGIPRTLNDAFSGTNTSHILAISGFNIAIIAGMLSTLARRLIRSRVLATLAIICGLVTYTLLVGASASVVRAAIMGSLSVLGLYYYRRNDALNALALAALIMSAQNPFVVFDLSFQLSFLATLGLVFFVEPLTPGFERALTAIFPAGRARQIARLPGDSVIVTLAAQIATLPLLIFIFHRLSLVGLVANVLVLPAQAPAMVLGGLATLVGMLLPPVGQVIAWVTWGFLQWTILVVEQMAALPFTIIDLPRWDILPLALYYLFLFSIPLIDWRALISSRNIAAPSPLSAGATPVSPSPAPASRASQLFGIGTAAAVVLIVWLWNLTFALPDGKTHIAFLDAGGPATFVRTANGSRILIDGGASPSAVVAALGDRMPFWDRSLDLAVLTRPDDDHLSGLVAALERLEVRQIIQPLAAHQAQSYLCALVQTDDHKTHRNSAPWDRLAGCH